MVYLTSALFIIEFFLIVLIMLYTLLKKGVTFKVGISFGVLFFIFIPVWIMILTGTLELSQADFHYTTLSNVVFDNNIHSSLLLLGFLFSIVLYLYFPSRYSTNVEANDKFKPSSKAYLTIYAIGMLIVFIGSGLLEGGRLVPKQGAFYAVKWRACRLNCFSCKFSEDIIHFLIVF